jgi:hypothetical protein
MFLNLFYYENRLLYCHDAAAGFEIGFPAFSKPLGLQNYLHKTNKKAVYENSCKQQAAAVHNTACDVLSFLSGGAVARCSVCAPLSLRRPT